ncbi:SGNH/GDSL hydrolase family protein [Variovorax sp. RA8]|uniref:SGNH/GDSL hydrolase family protein n=1 Tax=Variovorax sp. (strain JCM 16519 / RA8) TaxID=662548 RepID=UPI0013160CA6|nr:SGNH/GDSL hydrolase family protein [Variovorax sp. RA8]VTU34264.1 hypothetical protein RA8CHR_04938 [Variovorax sp. RA8]
MLLDFILSSRLFNWFFGTMHGRDERIDAAAARGALSAFAFAVLAGCGGGGGGSGGAPMALLPAAPKEQPAEQPIKPPPICSVTLYGDSILHGGTVAGQLLETPAAAIQRMRPMYRLVDRSRNGDSVLLRLPSFLADQIDTRFVVIEHGMNDAGNGFDYREPLRSMVQRVKALKATPVVTGLSHVRGAPAWRDTYDALARQVATEEGAIFADWGAAPYSDADMADDVHPAQAYSTRLVDKLVRALDAAAPECQS